MAHDFDDDDFYTDDDELAEDNQPGIIGDAKARLLESTANLIDQMKRNITFNEKQDYAANLNVLSSYTSHLLDLQKLEENINELADEEIYEKIEEIMNQTTVITLENIDSIIPEEDAQTISVDTDDDTSTDW